MAAIVPATLNTRYAHGSLGLRHLRANLGELRARSTTLELVVERQPDEIVEQSLAALDGDGRVSSALARTSRNAEATTRVVALLKAVAPEMVVSRADRRSATRPARGASAGSPMTSSPAGAT